MKIGVIGYKGRLGSELVRRGFTPCDADITNPQSVRENTSDFDVLINCAAFTDVDAAETSYSTALKINSNGVRVLRNWFRGRIIHISTDYVFDGKSGPYSEKYKLRYPVNNYGFSKLGGEVSLLEMGLPFDTVVRTTGLYGSMGHDDLASYARDKLLFGGSFEAASDLVANQTYIPHLAEALEILSNTKFQVRLVHIASLDVCSRYEFIKMIADRIGVDNRNVIPVLSNDIRGWSAKRPLRAGLKTHLAIEYGLPIYRIEDGLNDWISRHHSN